MNKDESVVQNNASRNYGTSFFAEFSGAFCSSLTISSLVASLGLFVLLVGLTRFF